MPSPLHKKTKAELIAMIEADPTFRLADNVIDAAARDAKTIGAQVAAVATAMGDLNDALDLGADRKRLTYFLRTFHEMRNERTAQQQTITTLRATVKDLNARIAEHVTERARIDAAVSNAMDDAVNDVTRYIKAHREREVTAKQIEDAIGVALGAVDWDSELADVDKARRYDDY